MASPQRGSSTARGYGAAWQKARVTYLSSHPFCVFCDRRGWLQAATVVDHKIPHKGDAKLFWDQENWQALCKRCHDGDKQFEEKRGYAKPTIGADGYPVAAE